MPIRHAGCALSPRFNTGPHMHISGVHVMALTVVQQSKERIFVDWFACNSHVQASRCLGVVGRFRRQRGSGGQRGRAPQHADPRGSTQIGPCPPSSCQQPTCSQLANGPDPFIGGLVGAPRLWMQRLHHLTVAHPAGNEAAAGRWSGAMLEHCSRWTLPNTDIGHASSNACSKGCTHTGTNTARHTAG